MTAKFYSEEQMKSIRSDFEKKVLTWAKVKTKKMFGCPCYEVNGKLFAFLVTGGIVITGLEEPDREKLRREHHGTPFEAGNRKVLKWIRAGIDNGTGPNPIIMDYVRKSHECTARKR